MPAVTSYKVGASRAVRGGPVRWITLQLAAPEAGVKEVSLFFHEGKIGPLGFVNEDTDFVNVNLPVADFDPIYRIINGEKPPRYVQYGGLDAFNAQMIEQKRSLALSEVLSQLDETHRRLISYIQSVPEEYFTRETRFRHRLQLDTSSHYPLHARAIQEWRERPVEERARS